VSQTPDHHFTGTQAAYLAAGGATPSQLRQIFAAYDTLADYMSDSAADHAARHVPHITPEDPHLSSDTWVLVLGSRDYPAILAAAPAPPVLLYGIGDPQALTPGVAIVGSRNLNEFGAIVASTAAQAAATQGLPVHSGLAAGVDAAAHTAALDANTATVAVLGCGTATIYPKENELLHRRILASGGAVISEHHPDTPVRPNYLMARNRIIVGLATVVVPAQMGLRSGTMHSVSAAIESSRSIVVARPRPGHENDPGNEGVMALVDESFTDYDALNLSKRAIAALDGRTPIADAVATDRPALVELITLAHRFSPLV
jgi:DNA processing protein